jgi:hypothetical protein
MKIEYNPDLLEHTEEQIPDNILSSKEDEKAWLDLVFANKVPQGYGMGSKTFDDHFRLKRKTLVGVFGMDNVGKTTFYLFMIMCYAKKHGLKFLILARENESASVRQSLIELFLGKYAYQCTEEEQKQAVKFCYKFFDIIKLDVNVNKENIFDILDKAYADNSYFACFIDPYNAVQHEQSPKSNYEFLDSLRRYQNKMNTSFHISMHISTEKARNYVYSANDKLTNFEGFETEVVGQNKVPRKNHVEGGQPIANKLDDIIVVHRIYKVDELKNYTLISIEKVKETRTGGTTTYEKPIMFKKELGYITFIDDNLKNPLKFTEVVKAKEVIKPAEPKEAFGIHDDGLAF